MIAQPRLHGSSLTICHSRYETQYLIHSCKSVVRTHLHLEWILHKSESNWKYHFWFDLQHEKCKNKHTTFPKQRFSQACACGWRRRARLVRGVLQNCRGICTPSKDHHHQHENCWCVSCHHHACWSHPSDIPLFFILSVQEREAELAMKTILVWQELQVMNAYMTFPESDSRFIVIILTGFYMTILITWKNLDAGSVHWVGTQVADRCDEASGA